MQWEEKTPWYAESNEGYRVSYASKSASLPYAAWEPGTKTGMAAIGYVKTAKAAKKLCEEHFNLKRRNT